MASIAESTTPSHDDLAPDACHTARQKAESSLRDIKSVTEASLATLDPDELLPLLLDRVLELLDCDTAAVLLLDNAGDQLVARAARGLEAEVRQGVRIPIGVGFAGRIAAQRHPVILDRVDSTTVANPILWEKGIRSMLGVPLVVGGALVGVLHVGSFSARTFDENEVTLLELVADKVAAAAHTSTASLERRAARVLQRSLLPSALPKHPQIEFASRYVPAELGDVGGDWYDAFVLPSGDVWVMTGDVVGHGLNPAIVMGRLRGAMRSYALLGMSPEDVVRGANRKLLYFEPGAMATVFCGVLSPPFDELRSCSAGHPPPVILRPGDEPQLLEAQPIPLLGALEDLDAPSSRWKVEDGSMLVLYTDGLIERRGEVLDEGLDRLKKAVHDDFPERLCAQLMDAMIGDYIPADDVAVLVLRIRTPDRAAPASRPTAPDVLVTRSELFECDPDSVKAARRFIAECVEQLGLSSVRRVQLIVSELATNAVVHARSPFDVTVERLNDEVVRVEVRDFGDGMPRLFNRGVEAEGGRGLQIVNVLAETWGVDNRPGGRGKAAWFTVKIGSDGSAHR